MKYFTKQFSLFHVCFTRGGMLITPYQPACGADQYS